MSFAAVFLTLGLFAFLALAYGFAVHYADRMDVESGARFISGGVFVKETMFLRFPDPASKSYNNTAYVSINFGFEVQIDQLARNDGVAIHKTGAIYGFAGPANPDTLPVNPPGQWNEFEIHTAAQAYTVFLNGTKITEYQNTDPICGAASTAATPTFIGLQTHTVVSRSARSRSRYSEARP